VIAAGFQNVPGTTDLTFTSNLLTPVTIGMAGKSVLLKTHCRTSMCKKMKNTLSQSIHISHCMHSSESFLLLIYFSHSLSLNMDQPSACSFASRPEEDKIPMVLHDLYLSMYGFTYLPFGTIQQISCTELRPSTDFKHRDNKTTHV
jgi:hypothetical protein